MRHGEARLRFKERNLNRLGLKCLLDDVLRLRQRLVDVSACKFRCLEVVRMLMQVAFGMDLRRVRVERLEGVRDRRQDLVVDDDLLRRRAGVAHCVRDNVRQHVANEARRFPYRNEHRQVLNHDPRSPLSGHVGCGKHPDDARHGHCRRRVDSTNLRAGMCGENRSAIQHAGNVHIIDERLRTGCLLQAAIAGRGPPYAELVLACQRRIALPAELFAKVVIPPRFRPRQNLAVVPRLACRLDTIKNALPAGTATEIGRKPLPNLVAIGCFVALQHRGGPNKNAWNAEAALDGAFVYERLAEDSLHILRKSLERNDIRTFHLFRFAKAGQHG